MNFWIKSNRVFKAVTWLGVSVVITTIFLITLLNSMHVGADEGNATNNFGYGFNVASWDVNLIQSMGFNWMKVFNGPGSRLPVNILLRVDANATHLADITGFGDFIGQLAEDQKGYVDAYEIGNEPNLDASYGWTVSPNAAEYVTLLCTAYSKIKAVDPAAIIVSAGLAPTGRVSGNWNGHAGHNGFYQDEREFFKEFISAGGGNCLDAVGYHPYGFRADYDAIPDMVSADADQNCVNGFCFRGAEKIYELMAANGLGHKTMWATEYGWIVEPPDSCKNTSGWPARLWQIVSEDKQATNLVGSFEYARANWPWMEAMFVFNLNFNQAPWFPTCEQMRYYSVAGRPAQAALTAMPKVITPPTAELIVGTTEIVYMITVDQQPFTHTRAIDLTNIGTFSLTYTMTVHSGTLTPTLMNANGTIPPASQAQSFVIINSNGKPTGTYMATVIITATHGTIGVPVTIPVTLFIVDEIHTLYFPAILRQD